MVMISGGYNILLVDDSAIALEFTRRELEPAGHRVETVIDARETLGRLAEIEPDVVILDIMMPFINGFELCKKIRSDEKFKNTPIIMVSTKAYDADRDKAARMGADGYIIKPFNIERFNAIMDDLGCLKLSAWGVRGTLPMPQEGYIKYGGNTSCYSVQLAADRHLVLDAGTGIKGLSNALMNSATNRFDLDLLITHPHWDHIHGPGRAEHQEVIDRANGRDAFPGHDQGIQRSHPVPGALRGRIPAGRGDSQNHAAQASRQLPRLSN
jgi:CheY-like chemotaxis protein